ncbi:MAG: putative transport system permease protein [Verrucomicrobiota bacterium]|jgi:putative ABC transport system permease protein
MNWLRLGQSRWSGFVHPTQVDSDIEEELRFHLQMRTKENIARGMPSSEASQRAQRRFGNFNVIKDACRDVRGGGWLAVLGQDLRLAVRMLLKDRAFTIAAVVALGLSIGANTAIYTIASSVLFRPLPYPESERIMSIVSQDWMQPGHNFSLSYPDFVDYRARSSEFSAMGAFHRATFAVTGLDGEASQIEGAVVTSDLLQVLAVTPELGRGFLPAEDEPGSRAAIISHDFWQSQYRGSSDVIGAALTLDGLEYRVIGVMPPGFGFPRQNIAAQVWTTIARDREPLPDGGPSFTTHRDGHFLSVLGRLKPESSSSQADANLKGIGAELARSYPETNGRFNSSAAIPWLAYMTDSVRPPLLMLIGGALCLLCVACANVANLLLARGATRQREIAIRAALGAGRRRILRQLLTESLVLALVGGSVGLLVALAGIRYIVSVLPPNFPRLTEIGPHLSILAFTGVVTVVTSCVFGLAPAWRSARCQLAPLLNDCSRGSSETRNGRRVRSALVVAEMVLAFVLLSGACFLFRSLRQLENVTPGFNPRNLLTAKISLRDNLDTEAPAKTAAFYQKLLERVNQLPGVSSAAATSSLPLSGADGLAQFYITGRVMDESNLPRAQPCIVTPRYFEAMGIPLKAGRDFDARDRRDASAVIIINESLAAKHFGGENPVGKRMTATISDSSAGFAEREIIGVVGDVKSDNLAAANKPQMYLPHTQCAALAMTLVLRSEGPPEVLFESVKDVIAFMDKDLPFEQRRMMTQYLVASVAQPRLNSTVLSAFALVAVILTAVGIYGVMAYSITQRRHEIGIRIALGAQKLTVFRLLMRSGLGLVALSIVGGSLCTLMATKFLRGFAYGLAGSEAPTLFFVTLLLSAVALGACWIPAQRATEVDPLALLGQR